MCPLGVMRTSLLDSPNQRSPSGPAMIDVGTLITLGSENMAKLVAVLDGRVDEEEADPQAATSTVAVTSTAKSILVRIIPSKFA